MAEITRSNALALINQQNSNEIWQAAVQFSAALRTFRKIPMSAKQRRMPVIDVLPNAGFVGETMPTRRKTTTNVEWANKMLEAEEIACIVPIPENVLDDSSFDIWAEVKPRIAEAIGVKLDAAVFFGDGAPVSWPDALEIGARAAGNVVNPGAVDLGEDLNQLLALVEEDGFDPDKFWSHTPQRKNLRGLRDDQNRPIYVAGLREGGPVDMVHGIGIDWVRNGAWIPSDVDETGADFIVGDSKAAILGLRQDMAFKLSSDAVLTTGEGASRIVATSAFEEDMVFLRCKFRVGFQVADPTTREGGSDAYPFAVLGVAGS